MKFKVQKLDVFFSSINLLNKNEKINLLTLSLLSFISSTLEIFSVLSIYPFINIVLDKEIIFSNSKYKYLWNLLASPSVERFIVYLFIILFIIIISSSLFTFYTQYLLNKFAANIQKRLGKDLIKYLMYTNYEWHIQENSIKLMNLFTTHLSYWSRGTIKQIPLLIGYLSAMIIPLFTLISLSPKYGVLFLLFISSLIFYFLRFIRSKTNRLSNIIRLKIDELNILLVEIIQGIKDVKLSNNEANFINKFDDVYKNYLISRSSIDIFNLVPVTTILMISQLAIIALGTILFLSNIESSSLISIMAIIVLLAFKIVPLLNRFGNSLNNISNAYVFVKLLNKLYFQLKKLNYSINVKETITNFSWKKLSLKKIYYYYPLCENASLKNISLEIHKGNHYGFVGFSGAGKSTTVDICNGLLTPSKGQILLDGVDLKKFGYRKWQSKIGYVPQDPKINDLSIRENIAFGLNLLKIDNSKVLSCLEMVGLGDFIGNLPKGIFTVLGERGKLLSGGQKQLIAIARALYKDPDVIILDEATSSLDALNQDLIRQVFRRLKKRITILSIAHQFSNIKYVDHIFLFEDGQLVDQGNIDYLYKNSLLFKKFTDSQ